MSVPISRIGVTYILIAGAICHLLPVPEIIKAFLALPAFVIIPIQFGKSIPFLWTFCNKNFDADKDINFVIFHVLSWCVGFLFISLVAMLLFAIGAFNLWIFTLFIITVIIYSCFLQKGNINFNFKLKSLPIFLVLILSSLSVPLFIAYYHSYPFIWGYDVLRHAHYTLRIVDFNFLTYSTSYFPGFYVLMSMLSGMFNLHPYTLFWASKYLLSLIFAFGLYFFSYSLSKDKRIALLSAFIGVWIYIYKFRDTFHSIYSLQPKTLLFVLLPFLLGAIILSYDRFRLKLHDNKGLIKIFLLSLGIIILIFFSNFLFFSKEVSSYYHIKIPLSLTLILIVLFGIHKKLARPEEKSLFLVLSIVGSIMLFIHLTVGLALYFLVLLALVIYTFFLDKKHGSYILYAMLLSFFFILLVLNNLNLLINLYPQLPSEFAMISLSLKLEALETGYTKIVLLLFIIGILLSLIKREKLESVFILSVLFFIYFLPISSIWRILIATTPFVTYFAAKSIVAALSSLNKHGLKIALSFLSLFIVIILLANGMQAYQNELTWKSEEVENLTLRYYENVINTADWMRNNTSENTLIISDPMTMHFLAGLSDRIYVSRSLDPEKIALLHKILSQDSAKEISDEIWGLNFSSPYPNEIIPSFSDSRCISLYKIENNRIDVFVVVTGSTTKFISDKRYAEGYVRVPGGYHKIDENTLKNFQDERYFIKMLEIPDMVYLFKVKTLE